MQKGYSNYLGMDGLIDSIYFSQQDMLGVYDFITGIYAYEYLGYMGNIGVDESYKGKTQHNDSSSSKSY